MCGRLRPLEKRTTATKSQLTKKKQDLIICWRAAEVTHENCKHVDLVKWMNCVDIVFLFSYFVNIIDVSFGDGAILSKEGIECELKNFG